MHCDTRFLSILLNYVPNIKLFPLYFTKMTCFQPFYDTIKVKQSTIGTDVDSTPKEAIHMSEFLLALDDVLYYPILIIVLLAAGLYFTFTTGFVQFRWLRQSIRVIMEKPEKEGSISSFQALMVSTACRHGQYHRDFNGPVSGRLWVRLLDVGHCHDWFSHSLH